MPEIDYAKLDIQRPLPNRGVTCHFISLLHLLAVLEDQNNSVFNPKLKEVLDFVKGKNNNILPFLQLQDEIIKLCGGMQDDPNDDIEKLYNNNLILKDIKVTTVFIPESCGLETNKVSSKRSINIKPIENKDVQTLINQSGTKEDITQPFENSPKCIRVLKINELLDGKYLVVTLSRNIEGKKDRSMVEINKIIQLEDYIYPNKRFNLRAVIIHHGSDINSGHYIVFIKNKTGDWYFYNDSNPPLKVDEVFLNDENIMRDSTTFLYEIID